MKVVKGNGLVTRNGTFIFPKGQELTKEELFGFIDYNTQYLMPKYRENMKLYLSQHMILNAESKEMGPDNKLVVNLPKYIVDTYNGYFLGIPPKFHLKKVVITTDYKRGLVMYHSLINLMKFQSKLIFMVVQLALFIKMRRLKQDLLMLVLQKLSLFMMIRLNEIL